MKKGHSPQLGLQTQHNLDTKEGQRHHKKCHTEQLFITSEFRFKDPKQTLINSESSVYKNNITLDKQQAPNV